MHSIRMRTVRSVTVSRRIPRTPPCNHTPPATMHAPPATTHAPCNHTCPLQPCTPRLQPRTPPPHNHTCPLGKHACPSGKHVRPPVDRHTCKNITFANAGGNKGLPRHKENAEFGSSFFQAEETQRICQKY